MRKPLQILGWLAIAVVLLVILTIIGLWAFFPIEKVKNYAVEKGSDQLGRPVAVEGAEISFWGGLGVKLRNVTVGNPPGMPDGKLLQAENVDVKLRILPLLGGNYRIDQLVVNRPEITMLKRADGLNNYTFTKLEEKAPPELVEPATPEAKAAAAAVTFEKLVINHGSLAFTDDSAGTSFEVQELNLSTSLNNPRPYLYKSSGEIGVGSISILTDMPLPPLTINVRYNAEYDMEQKLITLDAPDIELNGLKFTLRGSVTDPGGLLKSQVNVKSGKISVADLLSLVPPEKLEAVRDFVVAGDFSFDLDVDYDPGRLDTLTYYGTALVTSMNVSHREVPGALKFRRALIDFKNDNLRFNIEEGYFDSKPLKGHLVVDNFSNPTVNGELAGTMNLAYLKPFLPMQGKHDIAGESVFDIKLSGKTNDFSAMSFSGSVQVLGGKYNSAVLFEPVESFDLDIYFDNRLTHVKKLAGRMKSGSLSFEGRLNDLVPYFMADSVNRLTIAPTVEGSLSGSVNLAVANAFLPPEGNPELTGELNTDIKISGILTQYDKLRPSGKISIRNASYTDSLLPEPVKHFEADMAITPDTITIGNMMVRFVSSDVSFSGKLADPFPYLLPMEGVDREAAKKPIFLFRLTSHRFDSDKLFPEAVPGSSDGTSSVVIDSISPFILPDIDGQGTFEVDTLIYSKVEFASLVGKIKIRERKIECYDATGKVYTGDVAGSTTIDLNDFENPKYTGAFKATNVEANDFISRFTSLDGVLYGKINLEGDYAATGWEPEQFINSLTMQSDWIQQQGKLVTSGVVHSVLSGLASKAGETFEKEQALKDLKTNIVVKDGKVGIERFKTKLGGLGDIEVGGFYSLLSSGIDFGGTVLLSEEWTQKMLSQKGLLGGLAGLLSEKSVKRIKLPIAFGGTIDKPSFEIDYDAMAKNLGDNLKKDAVDQLQNLFKKK